MHRWAVRGAVGGAWRTDLLVDLAELLQVVLQEDDPLSLGQTAAGLVAVVLRALRRKQETRMSVSRQTHSPTVNRLTRRSDAACGGLMTFLRSSFAPPCPRRRPFEGCRASEALWPVGETERLSDDYDGDDEEPRRLHR